jgi:hypothetical protein
MQEAIATLVEMAELLAAALGAVTKERDEAVSRLKVMQCSLAMLDEIHQAVVPNATKRKSARKKSRRA